MPGAPPLGNVTLIAQLAKEVGVEQVAPLESVLIGAAETLDAGDMRIAIQATRLRVDPDGVLAADNRAHERRWFNLDQSYEGEWFAQGRFDAEGGALVRTLLDAITETATCRGPALGIGATCRRLGGSCGDAAALCCAP